MTAPRVVAPGVQVRLDAGSGSPIMSVGQKSARDKRWQCQWFDKDGMLQTQWFLEEQLKIVDDEK